MRRYIPEERKIELIIVEGVHRRVRRGAVKSWAFPIFLFTAQPNDFSLDGLKKLEQRSQKCVELRGNMQSKYIPSVP
jgi:hypothetical protein